MKTINQVTNHLISILPEVATIVFENPELFNECLV